MPLASFIKSRQMSDKEINEYISLTDERQLEVDIYQADNIMYIICPLPGISLDEIDISVHNDMLNIRGKANFKYTTKPDHYLVRECHWGDVSRSIILPLPIDSNAAQATFDDGILIISLPITEQVGKITVKKLAI